MRTPGALIAILLIGLPGCRSDEQTREASARSRATPMKPSAQVMAARPTKRVAKPPTRPRVLPPASAAREFGPEVKRLFKQLFCRGRRSDSLCQALELHLSRFRWFHLIPLKRWFARQHPRKLPPVVLYPFSGGDLATSLATFARHRRYVQMSLEHGGPPDPLRSMTRREAHFVRERYTAVVEDLSLNGFNKSEVLQAQERAGMPGVLPLLLTGIRLHKGQPTGLRYFAVEPDGRIRWLVPADFQGRGSRARRQTDEWPTPRFGERFANLELRFRLPGDRTDRTLRHISVSLSNQGLKNQPGVARLIQRLGPRVVMIKANSWLLHRRDFSHIRDTIFKKAAYLVSDVVDAPPPSWLRKQGFKVSIFGDFECFSLAPEPAAPWREEYRRVLLKRRPPPLPFRFGYRDCQRQNSLVIAQRPLK